MPTETDPRLAVYDMLQLGNLFLGLGATALGGLPATVAIVETELDAMIENAAFSQQLTHTDGTGNVTWSVSAGTLPTGITLSSAGLVAGTPTVADEAASEHDDAGTFGSTNQRRRV